MPRPAGEFLETMNQMQHQSMLQRMMSGMSGGNAAPEMLAGSMMSRGMAVGQPLISAGMGMLGLDPMSLGLRAGQAAWSSGAGALGAGMAGMGVAAGAGIIGAGVSYAGGQMMNGAQQQLGLNQGLRQNFNFQNSQGGMGFTSGQGFDIGNSLRSMTGAQGPSGEVATFGELSKLAQNMGRMGLGQNVRTVKEFKENFKQMVDTLKVMAHDMGTSMEEAQKMMVSMKGSGIFSKTDAMRMTSGIRSGALAGGLAMSEMTGAANIGSQISRSMGGLGRQGAFGGMKTMEQIGVATKVGAINEEDIYNATGLTGAEGRQALASSQMQQTASFLQGGRGRRFLASVAGKDGQLDEGSAMEYLMGGNVGTGRTMSMAGKNLGGVGRANFLRNEGRLRGAALEKFGGLAQSMVYQQWLGDRGHDANNMDDRSMLAFQRFSGMGRDEADVAIKQLQGMPDTLRELNSSKRNQDYSDSVAHRRNTQGVEGMRRKFDSAREEVQSKLQGVGSRILQVGQENLETWFNKTMGIYVSVATEGIDKIAKDLERGGPGAAKSYRQHFGVASGSGGAGGLGASLDNQKMKFAVMAGYQGEGKAAMGEFGKQNSELMKQAALAASGKTPEEMTNIYQNTLAHLATTDKTGGAADMMARLNAAKTPAEKAAIVEELQRGAGVDKSGTMSAAINGQQALLASGGKYNSQSEFENMLGRKLSGADKTGPGAAATAGGLGITAGVDAALSALGPLGIAAKGAGQLAGYLGKDNPIAHMLDVGKNIERFQDVSGEGEQVRAMARMFTEKDSRSLISDAFGSDKKDADAARSGMQDSMQRIRSSYGKKEYKDYSDSDKGRLQVLAGVRLATGKDGAATLAAFKKDGMKGAGVNDMIDRYRSETGDHDSTPEEIMQKVGAISGAGAAALNDVNLENFRADLERVTSVTGASRKAAVDSGHMVPGPDGSLTLSKKTEKERAAMSPEARAAAELADKINAFDASKGPKDRTALEARLKKDGKDWSKLSADEQGFYNATASHEEYYQQQGQLHEDIAKLSIPEQLKLARSGGLEGQIGAESAAAGKRYQGMKKKYGSDMGVAASMLGVDLSKEQKASMRGGTPQEQAARLAEIAGAGGDEGLKAGLAKMAQAKSPAEKAMEMERALAAANPESKKKIEERKDAQKDPNTKAMESVAKNTQGLKEAINGVATAVRESGGGKGNPEGGSSDGRPAGAGGAHPK